MVGRRIDLPLVQRLLDDLAYALAGEVVVLRDRLLGAALLHAGEDAQPAAGAILGDDADGGGAGMGRVLRGMGKENGSDYGMYSDFQKEKKAMIRKLTDGICER